jgi:hypothetical protein
MSDLNVFGNPADFNEEVKFYKDVYVFGRLYYEFEDNPLEILGDVNVLGAANFYGPVNFFENVNFDNLTVKKRLNVGIGGTTFTAISDTGNVGIGSTIPQQNLDVGGIVIVSEGVGVGTTNPTAKLEIIGNSLFDGISTFANNFGNAEALQVIGNAYISNNLGIGITNPSSNLTVSGDVLVTNGISTFDSSVDLYILGRFFDKFLDQ